MNDPHPDSGPARRERVPWYRVKVSPARQAAGLLALLLAAGFFYLMFGQGLHFFEVTSISMQPTLVERDRILAFPAKVYHRGDIVVLRDPTESGSYIVKRVIAVGGDTVQVFGGAVSVNGRYVSEPYRPEPIFYRLSPFKVGPGQVFVLGDNANRSADSHNWAAAYAELDEVVPGALPVDAIVGKVRYIYLPPGRAGQVVPYPVKQVAGL